MGQKKLLRVIVHPDIFDEQLSKNEFDLFLIEKLAQRKIEVLLVENQDLIESYARCYESTLNKGGRQTAEFHLCQCILSQLVISEDKPRNTIQPSNINLPEEIKMAITPLTQIEQNLVMAACQDDNFIVVIPDNHPNCSSESFSNIRAQLSVFLERDIILYASEFVRPIPYLITEGKTDWKHLKAALKWLRKDKKFIGLQITFDSYEDAMGDQKLLEKCKSAQTVSGDDKADILIKVNICIFDRDRKDTVERISDKSNPYEYKKWSANYFSLPLPVPKHRADANENFYLCIEFYYQDKEIKLSDKDGRRLFVSNEFDQDGLIQSEDIKCTNERYKSKTPLIIDTGVERNNGTKSIALSKDDFANNILNANPPFDQMDFSAFEEVFKAVERIIRDITANQLNL